MTEAVVNQPIVDELAAIIHVQPCQGEGQAEADSLECFDDQAAFPNHNWRSLCPSGRDVGQNQAVNIASAVYLPAMSHQIHLHVAGWRFLPISERTHFDKPPWFRHPLRRLLRDSRAPWHPEQTINRRSAHR